MHRLSRRFRAARSRPGTVAGRLNVAAGGIALSVVAVASSWLAATSAFAHALDPVLLELRERDGGKVDVTWKAPSARVPGVDLVPRLPEGCTSASPVEKVDEEDATISRWTLDCGGSIVGRTVGVTGLEVTDALVRIVLASGAVDRRVLGASHPTMTIEGEPTSVDVLVDYARLGVEHIAGGIDHLLFVFGLLLLAGGVRRVLATVTAFTFGHSVTLVAAALELVRVPQGPVEVLIAVTIYLLAVELARHVPDDSTAMRRRPWAMAFTFGLLHGLGFAGALREAGLPQTDVPLALFAFNVGIELGQIAFVLVVEAAAYALRPLRERLPASASSVPVYAMGIAACYWILDRASALF